MRSDFPLKSYIICRKIIMLIIMFYAYYVSPHGGDKERAHKVGKGISP